MVGLYRLVKKYGKQLVLASVAGAGAVIAARPIIKFGTHVFAGNTVWNSANAAVYEGFGYDMNVGQIINKTNLRNGVISTVIGVGLIAGATWLAKGGR